ncbi:hypothetical protein FRC01_006097 [Tulasnella sp. 417]|nr:hypothetical protein FRC01_006097 [Tulasnella sp. 417]
MDIFGHANPLSLPSSPHPAFPPALEGGESRTSSSPGDSTANASFDFASPHDPSATGHHFTPSSAPELSRLDLVDPPSPFQGYQNPPLGPETFWGSSLDYTSSRAYAGTRSRASVDPSNRLEIGRIEPGVSPAALFQASQSDPPHSAYVYYDQTKYGLSPSSIEPGQHQLPRRGSPPAPTWSDYRFPQDITPTKMKSQDDVLPPFSTLLFDPNHSLCAYDQFDTNTPPPNNPPTPSELYSISIYGERLEPASASHTPPSGIDRQAGSSRGERPQGRPNLKREPQTDLPSISAAAHIGPGFSLHDVPVRAPKLASVSTQSGKDCL